MSTPGFDDDLRFPRYEFHLYFVLKTTSVSNVARLEVYHEERHTARVVLPKLYP